MEKILLGIIMFFASLGLGYYGTYVWVEQLSGNAKDEDLSSEPLVLDENHSLPEPAIAPVQEAVPAVQVPPSPEPPTTPATPSSVHQEPQVLAPQTSNPESLATPVVDSVKEEILSDPVEMETPAAQEIAPASQTATPISPATPTPIEDSTKSTSAQKRDSYNSTATSDSLNDTMSKLFGGDSEDTQSSRRTSTPTKSDSAERSSLDDTLNRLLQ